MPACSPRRGASPADVGVDVRTTLLAAHAVPPEFAGAPTTTSTSSAARRFRPRRDAGLADAVDAFCETIGFTAAQTRRVFAAARAHGLPVKLHADQLSDTGGAALAAEFGALSADHLEYTNDAGVAAMARAGTVAVLLPGAFYALRETRVPPIAALRRHGVPMAVATDCNPGTSPATSLLLMLNMACTLFRLTPEEALAGATRHAARALGLRRSRHARVGQRADIALWDIAAPAELALPDRRQSLHRHRARGPSGSMSAEQAGGRMNLCDLVRGDAPLVIDVPHAGTYRAAGARGAPDAGRARTSRTPTGTSRSSIAFARDAGVTLLVATHSRYVVDLNRDPTGAALYPGADNTELCPTRTFANEAIYADGEVPMPPRSRRAAPNTSIPYHALLAAEIERVRARHGYAILLDGHSIRSEVPRFFAGRLPDLNLGTADGASCALSVGAAAEVVLAGAGRSRASSTAASRAAT